MHGIRMTDYLFIFMHSAFNVSYKVVYVSIFYVYKRIYQILTILHVEYIRNLKIVCVQNEGKLQLAIFDLKFQTVGYFHTLDLQFSS